MIVLTGTFDCHPDQREAFVAATKNVIDTTRAEDGCIQYVVSCDLWDQNRFYAIERWRDPEGLEKHGRSSHVGEWVQTTQPMIRSASVFRWSDVVEERLF
jgi:quinol monooxygenase YgiN